MKPPLERPKYTVLSGHVFIWSHYLRIDLRLCAFDLRNAQFSTVLGLLRPQIPVEKGLRGREEVCLEKSNTQHLARAGVRNA